MKEYSMRRAWAGKLAKLLYGKVPGGNRLLRVVTRLEGGEMTSLTLRDILRESRGVEVGAYSYGSLLTPGMADPRTTIGRYVSIGPGVRRFGAAHPMNRLTMHPYFYRPEYGLVPRSHDVDRTECVIEDEVWVGANVIILPGCRRIGRGAVIGAGAVVTRDVAALDIVAGNPARVIGQREEIASAFRQAALWERSPSAIASALREAESESGIRE